MKEDEIIEVNVKEVHPGYILVEHKGLPATLQVTELTWKPGIVNPNDYVSAGESISVKVLKVTGDRYSISLREAAPEGNPWRNPPKIGEVFHSKTSVVADYGYFFDITDYCRALLLKTDTNRSYEVGDSETVVVASIDLESHKVSLRVTE